jgi:hypothetical protein
VWRSEDVKKKKREKKVKFATFHDDEGGKTKTKQYRNKPLEDDLFKQYAENLKQMLKKANSNQELLLDVLNKLFVYMRDPQTKKKIIRINPELSEELLQEVIVQVLKIRLLLSKL